MKIEITGINDVVQTWAALPKKILSKGVTTGIRAVGQEGSKDLKARTPMKTGALRKSIGSRLLKKRGDELAALKIGGTRVAIRGGHKARKQDYILRFLEKGTKRHMLMAWDANNKRYSTLAIRRMNRSGMVSDRAVNHPGIRARYLLRQLVATNTKKYATEFERGMMSVMDKL